jgi:hypothetical protein
MANKAANEIVSTSKENSDELIQRINVSNSFEKIYKHCY